jgi:hypothetical protein
MLSHFEGLGYPCPTHTNPADFALDLIAVDLRSAEVERASYRRLVELTAKYRDAQQSGSLLVGVGVDPTQTQQPQEMQQHSKEARDHIFNQMRQQHINVVLQTLILIARYWSANGDESYLITHPG